MSKSYDQTAEQRISEEMESRMSAIERYYNVESYDEQAEAQAELEPLTIDREILIHIQLSTGGPGDGFKLRYSTDAELIGGVYYFADWYDYAERILSYEEAERVAEAYGVYVEPER